MKLADEFARHCANADEQVERGNLGRECMEFGTFVWENRHTILAALSTDRVSPASGNREGDEGKWDHRFRRLEMGEVILATDEVQNDDGSWRLAQHAIGQPAPDPCYTSHRTYRRLKDASLTTPESEPVVVQADRDRFAQIAEAAGHSMDYCERVRKGECDSHQGPQLLAAHRIEASREAQAVLPGEIGELVERLRSRSRRYQIGSEWGYDLRNAADMILSLQAEVSRFEALLGEAKNQFIEIHDYDGGAESAMADECVVERTQDLIARIALTEPTSKYGHGSAGTESAE